MKKTVVHFEIGCNDIVKTAAFYKSVFDWDITPQGNSATIESLAQEAITGHLNKLGPNEPQKYITIYIQTDTLQEDLSKAEALGGKILVPPINLPNGRAFAWIEDVAGNIVGLITPEKD